MVQGGRKVPPPIERWLLVDASTIAKALDSGTSKAIMDRDRVRPAQVKSYLPLMGKVAKVLPEVPENAHGVRAGVTPEVSKSLGELMVGLPKSHRWVKGLVAVYIATRQS